MKIDMPGVQAFVAIADAGGFGKAGQVLHLTQTALSRRLKNLETFLGAQLIERSTRSMALTRIGENFLPQARRLMTDLQAALVEIRETGRAQRGDVTMACVPTVGVRFLPAVIRAYSARFPDNRIKVLDHSSAGVEQAVLRREAEFGINIAGQHDAGLQSERLLEDRFVLVCRHDHALAARRRITWRQLRGHPLILPGPGSSNRPLIDQGLGEAGEGLSAFFEVQRSATAVGLVAEGVAAAVVPSLALQQGSYPDLRVVSLVDPVLRRGFVLLARRGASLSPAAQALRAAIVRQARVALGSRAAGS